MVTVARADDWVEVSVLFNEPKLLKSTRAAASASPRAGFSALQRAEIAEMCWSKTKRRTSRAGFSALQRAEIAEIVARRGAD